MEAGSLYGGGGGMVGGMGGGGVYNSVQPGYAWVAAFTAGTWNRTFLTPSVLTPSQKKVICLLYFHTTALCSRQQMAYNRIPATLSPTQAEPNMAHIHPKMAKWKGTIPCSLWTVLQLRVNCPIVSLNEITCINYPGLVSDGQHNAFWVTDE